MKQSTQSFDNSITTIARNSPLSRAQVQEVHDAITKVHPEITFEPLWIETHGDKDLKTSLRDLPQGNFFTKEIDDLQLSGKARISIHSAKDLPIPLSSGLRIVALTRGVDNRDALVLRDNENLSTLKYGAKIATSSIRRDEMIKELGKKLCNNFCSVDIRGTIGKRLEKLFSGEVDGVIIAKAALIRLQLEQLNHITLDGPTARYQGQLAIIARSTDCEMKELFSCLDTRKVLHTGLEGEYPLIETIPFAIETLPLLELQDTTHLIITSKMAAEYFFKALEVYATDVRHIPCIAVGKATSEKLKDYGFQEVITAEDESSEGVVKELQKIQSQIKKLFWPHSARSRSTISDFVKKSNLACSLACSLAFVDCPLYDTKPKRPEKLPDLQEYDELFFSSPSTVDAFFEFYKTYPRGMLCTTQGKVTENHLKNRLELQASEK